MKLNILKIEVIFQIILSLGSLFYILVDYSKHDQASDFFIALFFIGVANLLGFLIRISTVASKFHRYYFFGVLAFFLLLYTLVKVDVKMDYTLNYMVIGGVLFNIYYLYYGFLVIKKISNQVKLID
ncbi:hypothetical protein [Chryseobacterium sp.]|uniref:hypothetical protein n=1 Tax=Chryseobacterium sp. TaxID=1871047 RepID=UPI002FC8CFC6